MNRKTVVVDTALYTIVQGSKKRRQAVHFFAGFGREFLNVSC
jgi:hypothetical protein